jgi:Flp pilus assembly protein TadB
MRSLRRLVSESEGLATIEYVIGAQVIPARSFSESSVRADRGAGGRGRRVGGFILPSLAVERRASQRRRDADMAIASLVEWTHALVLSGRPVDSAVITLARRGSESSLVDEVLGRVADLYTLGAPLHVSLIRVSREAALPSLTRLAERLEHSRELGQGSISVLEDAREEFRTLARERLLQSASQVEGKMTLVLTLCCLPALALLIVIPLFVTLLAGLFG